MLDIHFNILLNIFIKINRKNYKHKKIMKNPLNMLSSLCQKIKTVLINELII
jgi:hypothetical protein